MNAQEKNVVLDGDSIVATPNQLYDRPDTAQTNGVKIYGWTISQRLGERMIVERDTSLYNFHQSTLMDSKDIAVSYLSNIGSPAQSKIFFDRDEPSLFSFLDTYGYSLMKPEKKVFLNTKIPYSNIFYQRTESSSQTREERFNSELSWNINKKLNVGFDINYLYARGYYSNLASKEFSYDLFASYISRKYEMHAFVYNNNFINSENGGLASDSSITDPVKNQSFRSSTDIDVNFSDAWNRVKGRQIYLNNKYNLGFSQTDTIPVSSIILTSYYADQQRKFISEDDSYVGTTAKTATDLQYQENNYTSPANDNMAYWSFKNTLGISLNEGFRKWVKFGLTAFVEQDFRKYKLPNKTFASMQISTLEAQNATVIGGVLSKEKGRLLRYRLSADLGVLGYNLGEFRAAGKLTTRIKFGGKDAEVSANAYIKNLKPTFFENNFYSKYISWDNNFSDIRRVYVGGEIYLPQTKTRIKGGVENLQNYIYYGSDKYIAQEGGSIQVIGLQLDQKLNAGPLHWDNQIAYQVSSNTDALPLPLISAYSNVYLQTVLSKVLTLQMGVDARLFTKYYAPGYDPVILQFYNQKDTKIGNFPISTAYINLHLKKTRFFIMMYNIMKGVGNREYFTTAHYPVNPMIFKMGLSWDFDN